MSHDWGNWGRRRNGRPADPPAQAPAAAGPPPPAGGLPPPPAGYAWAQTAMGLMLVQLAPAPSAYPPAIRQPQGVVPYAHPAQPYAPGAPLAPAGYGGSPPPETCTLVKPGGRDTYAELLAQLPDLVPPTQYDAMRGRPNPLVVQELAGDPAFAYGGGAPHPEFPAIARERGVAYDRPTMPDLGQGPPPPPAPAEEAKPAAAAPAPVPPTSDPGPN